ncbi:hypothetical protein [Verrucomicrobium sp. BvORR034]|uniref:hypothetical protein n=1 Tax=Verrucomicrobium sp. BvORR034 TaxID=1396418 RepID=UPI002240FA6D|nr:hypothetical protein [Verrucomicrobium sp. BvORR034]
MSPQDPRKTSRRSFLAATSAFAAGSMLTKLQAAGGPKIVIPPGALEHISAARKAGGVSLLSAPSAYTGIQTIAGSDGLARYEWFDPDATGLGYFTGLEPDSGDLSGLVGAELAQSETAIYPSPATSSGAPSYARPGRLTNDDDISQQFDFSLDISAGYAVQKVVLQVKTSNYLRLTGSTLVGLGGASGYGDAPFTASIVQGGSPIATTSVARYTNSATISSPNTFAQGSWDPSDGDTTYPGGTGTFYFTFQYVWTGLSLSSSPFTINFVSGAGDPQLGHAFSVDTIQADVEAL